MGIFSLFSKKKQVQTSSTAARKKYVPEYAKATGTSDDISEKRNVIYQESKLTLLSKCNLLPKGFPCDYFFPGDGNNKYAEMPLLTPLKINMAKVLENGVPGKQSWEGSSCFLIEESDDYFFYNYACYSDGSGGCNVRQSKAKPKEIVFFGKSRAFSCVFHDLLVQVDVAGRDLFLYVKNVHNASERIYPCFGTKKDDSDDWDRYAQDKIQSMDVDYQKDAVVIKVLRSFTQFSEPNDPEYICNADTQYVMYLKYNDGKLHLSAEYPELNITQIFQTN